jgi:hypothetical protein
MYGVSKAVSLPDASLHCRNFLGLELPITSKYFRRKKIGAKYCLLFFHKTCKAIHNEKDGQIFANKRRKSPKIVIITLMIMKKMLQFK